MLNWKEANSWVSNNNSDCLKAGFSQFSYILEKLFQKNMKQKQAVYNLASKKT